MTIEAYLTQLAGWLTVPPATREAILHEVRDHLEDAARHGTDSGLIRASAEEQATAAFGSPATVAVRFNAVHPLHWDARRFGAGILWGIAATWVLWTLLTYPALVQLASQGQALASADTSSPWSLLFYATPLSFGLFNVLATYGYWFVPLFLLFYGLIPFRWGRRAEHGWQPGLAFGLGVLLGFPWLLPAIVYRWEPWNPLAILLPVIGIWLLAPVALAAGVLGRRSLMWQPAIRVPRRGKSLPSPRLPIRRPAALVIASCLGVALLGVNAWSFVRAARLPSATLPPLSQQLRAAQANLPFTLRQPTYVPPGMALVSVTAKPGACRTPCVELAYHGPHGTWLNILEMAGAPPSPPTQASSPYHSAYQVSEVTGGGQRPIWWLGDSIVSEHQLSITWEQDGIAYFLDTNSSLSVDGLEYIAGTMG